MKARKIHFWDVSPKEAILIQKRLLKGLRIQPLRKIPKLIASADVSFNRDRVIGAVVVMKFPTLEAIERIVKKKDTAFPYIPTLLSFREGPVLCECFNALKKDPELIIFDGQGIAHPRKMGLATHLGILLKRPSIGCAKSKLYGETKAPAVRKGSFRYIKDNDGLKIGAILRTREGVKPVFISPGHMINIEDSIKIILQCSKKYRIPEPIRMSHSLSKEIGSFKL
jgi:deoxyribonuclease V